MHETYIDRLKQRTGGPILQDWSGVVCEREVSNRSRQRVELGERVQRREELLRVEEQSQRLHRCHFHHHHPPHHNRTLRQWLRRRCQQERWRQWQRFSKDNSRDSHNSSSSSSSNNTDNNPKDGGNKTRTRSAINSRRMEDVQEETTAGFDTSCELCTAGEM